MIDFNHVIVVSIIIVFIPLSVMACLIYHPMMKFVTFAMVFSTIFPDYLRTTFYHQEWYKTPTWGFDVVFSDLSALVLFVCMVITSKQIRWMIPLTIPSALFFLVAFASWLMIDPTPILNPAAEELIDRYFYPKLFALFGLWKLMRFYFTFWVLVQIITSYSWGLKVIIYALAINLLTLFAYALRERYWYGGIQISIDFGSPHVFSAYVGGIGVFFLSLLFGSNSLKKKFLCLFLYLAALACVILSIGKSSFVSMVLSSLMVILFVFPHYATVKNFIFVILFFLCGLGFFARSYKTLAVRLNSEAYESSLEGRETVNAEAYKMAQRNIFGVGLGNYVAVSVPLIYKSGMEVYAISHNTYFLTLAETGFLGLAILICKHLRLLQLWIVGLMANWRNKTAFVLLVGSFCGWFMIFFQGMFHFTSSLNQVAFIIQVLEAIIVGIYINKKTVQFVI